CHRTNASPRDYEQSHFAPAKGQSLPHDGDPGRLGRAVLRISGWSFHDRTLNPDPRDCFGARACANARHHLCDHRVDCYYNGQRCFHGLRRAAQLDYEVESFSELGQYVLLALRDSGGPGELSRRRLEFAIAPWEAQDRVKIAGYPRCL